MRYLLDTNIISNIGWHHHHYPHFALRHRYWGPVVYGYAAFPRCHWVRMPTGFMKVCNGYPY